MFPGAGTQLNRRYLICWSRAFLPERCAASFFDGVSCARCVPESKGMPQEFRQAMAGEQSRSSLPRSVLVAFHFLGTLPAHWPAQ